MKEHARQTMAGGLLLLGLVPPVAVWAADDAVGQAWQARARQAVRNLSRPDLDACDTAREKAFADFREQGTGALRTFQLAADIRGQRGYVTYSYRGGSLVSFDVGALPRLWVATRRGSNKTVSILVAPAQCAMDFCPTDPLGPGVCPGETLG